MPRNSPESDRTGFLEPHPYGYVYVGARVAPPARGPFVWRDEERERTLARFRVLADELEELPSVVATTVYEAVLMPPLEGGPGYDVVLLVAVTSPDDVADVLDSDAYRQLDGELLMTARNTRRIGETGDDPSATYLLNHFTAPDPERAVEVWEELAHWYVDRVGVDNSTLLQPLDEAPYTLVNHVRLPGGPVRFLVAQITRPSFFGRIRDALREERMRALPVFYRRR
ncbi:MULTISPECIES: hypothetical protein [unclassified Nocardiopsis]|uniref:hypothetical protein n=1 Tax=unclassified Nocardiopsis TaxID=2649073 RepID=UPI00066D82FE|nr:MULTISPECIES: hypothetical protein [unclassified Nocardiopsis]MBQ1082223.1 hypothetical protein [Nocardiopsis sp. B62]